MAAGQPAERLRAHVGNHTTIVDGKVTPIRPPMGPAPIPTPQWELKNQSTQGKVTGQNTDIYDGFPLDGTPVAEWKIAKDRKGVRMRITGFVQEEPYHSEEFVREYIPIAYGNEIILAGGS